MSFKVKRKVQKVVSFALIAFFLASVPCAEVAAAETNGIVMEDVEVLEATIKEAPGSVNVQSPRTGVKGDIGITFSSDGIRLEISTEASYLASVIGVKDIRIQKKVWYGWQTVAVCSGVESEDASVVTCIVLYGNAEKDETYRILSVHYADVNGYEEFESTTGDFIFTY